MKFIMNFTKGKQSVLNLIAFIVLDDPIGVENYVFQTCYWNTRWGVWLKNSENWAMQVQIILDWTNMYLFGLTPLLFTLEYINAPIEPT